MPDDVNQKKNVVRFAPSPTGNLHIGSARTALFNYLFARQSGGVFRLRIEDTDRERSTREYTENILEGLAWLGIRHDGDVPHQSERGDIYLKHLNHLIEAGAAYVSKETPAKPGDRDEVIRFKNPNKKIVFNDLIRGDIEVDTADLGDFVIAKDMENPLYHLAVVVDDFEMGVTHIIRGDDGIANTPRQILIQEALGAPRPIYTHIPLILAPDRSKLSKRHGALAATEYKTMGYLPEAIVNFLALLGWNPGTEQEIFSMEELIEAFRIEKVQKSGAVFNAEKLDWFNKHYIGVLSKDDLKQKMFEFLDREIRESEWFKEDVFEKILPIVQEKIVRFGQVSDTVNEMRFFFVAPEYDTDKLVPPAKREEGVTSEGKAQTGERIGKAASLLQEVSENDFSAEKIKAALWDYATAEGRGNVLWPVRYALAGLEKSPDPFLVASVLGKQETLDRLAQASKRLSQ